MFVTLSPALTRFLRVTGINSVPARMTRPFRFKSASHMGGWPVKQVVGPPAFCPEKLRNTSTSVLCGLRVNAGTINFIRTIAVPILVSKLLFIFEIGTAMVWMRLRPAMVAPFIALLRV